MRNARIRGAFLVAAVLVGGLVGVEPASAALPSAASTAFTSPGTYSYVVPPRVTRLVFDAAGASGDGAPPTAGTPNPFGPTSPVAGYGGRVQGVLLVTPGETLAVTVGGAGASGGYNGGAAGGGSSGVWPDGKRGGGASDIRRGGSGLGHRVAVAGGGGGGRTFGGGGGSGGATPGEPGFFNPSYPQYQGRGGTGGGPGTLATGGTAGTATCYGRPCPAGSDGISGSFGSGGPGGNGQLSYSCGASGGGGGGGGGYWGGGGGAAGDDCFGGAGGGGGSSYAAPTGVVAPVMEAGVQYGHGAVTLTPVPASVTVGEVAFRGTAHLGTFPCEPPPPFGGGPCEGTFSGDWTGALGGTVGDTTFSVTWTAPVGSLNAGFQYAEWQCIGVETVLGFAIGSGSAVAQPGQVQGKWQVPGESFARDVIGVLATFTFNWVRVGTTATLVLDPVQLSIDVAGLGAKVVATGPQAGAAAFVVTSTGPVHEPPTCNTPVSDVEGTIAGTLPIVHASA